MELRGHERDRVEGTQPLHVCVACRSNLVHPVEWEAAGGRGWTVSRRCPNCWWAGSGTYGQALVDAFDQELEDGLDALIEDLRELTHANMAEGIERFVEALRVDAVLPEDF